MPQRETEPFPTYEPGHNAEEWGTCPYCGKQVLVWFLVAHCGSCPRNPRYYTTPLR